MMLWAKRQTYVPGCCAGVPLDDEGQYGAEAIVNTAAIDVLRRMPVRHPRYIMEACQEA